MAIKGGTWRATVHGVTRVRHDLATKTTTSNDLGGQNKSRGNTINTRAILANVGSLCDISLNLYSISSCEIKKN